MVSTRSEARRINNSGNSGPINNNNNNNQTERGNDDGHLPAIDATPRGHTMDVRVFLAAMATVIALAFTAGVMLGPTDPLLVDPVLSLLGMNVPSNTALDGKAGGGSSQNAAGATAEGGVASEMVVTADGTIFDNSAAGGDAVTVHQPKRASTDHVATLGRKIKETHVNIDTPVLEGTGEGLPFERDIIHGNSSQHLDKKTTVRDQTNPSGQHLLVDIKNLEAAFLNSERRLADALQASVKAGGLTLLSYHCHSLHPAGVSCVGVLLESHISFHTWPDEGVITLDLFTTSEKPLLPVLPKLEELFGIARKDPDTGLDEKVVTLWSHELRGFRTADARKAHYLDGESDLASWVTSPLEVVYKEQIVTVQTEHQRIDVWDTLERDDTPSYEDGLRLGLKPGDPRWLSHEHASPGRMLFLDGSLQTIKDNEREFHESLTHPAMFAHPAPKTVAIVGSGNGGVLREVLKHRTVQKATMIEIDAKVVEVSRKYLASVSDCADIEGSALSCFDDPRANLVIADAFQYFLEEDTKGVFDVVVVDLKDPEAHPEYTDPHEIAGLVDALSTDGVIAFQIGFAPSILDPRADKGVNPTREFLLSHLEANADIASIHVYEEAHCGYWEPRSFLVACRDVSCRLRWYAATDAVDYQIYKRVGGTKSGRPNLVHFDGATQRSFHSPPRAWESIYCRRMPTPFECAYRGLDLEKGLYEYFPDDAEGSAFEVRPVEGGEGGSAVFAKVNVPAGSYIMPTHLAASFEVSDDSMENIRGDPTADVDGVGKANVIEDFIDFVDAHGHPSLQVGSGTNFVEIGGSFLMRTVQDSDDANVRRWIPTHPEGGRPKYSPVYDRHRHSFDVFVVASRDIKAGEEVMKPLALWEH